MNAYDCLILNRDADSPAGHMAVGHLVQHLHASPSASAVKAAGPWPLGWRTVGAAIITPDGTMLELTRDDSALDVRGAEYGFTLVRVGKMAVPEIEGSAPDALTGRGVPSLRAAVWAVLGEFGTDTDRMARDNLLVPVSS